MIRRELTQAWGYEIFHPPLCVCNSDTIVLPWLDQVSWTDFLMYSQTSSSSWVWIEYSSYLSAHQFPRWLEFNKTSALASHFPERMQGCADWSLLVPSELKL